MVQAICKPGKHGLLVKLMMRKVAEAKVLSEKVACTLVI